MNKPRTSALCLAILCILLLGSCDMITTFIASRTRNIALIQLYNSSKQKTNKLQPNDTLFVEVQGLKAKGMYQVECLDPEGKLITMLTAQADSDGIIMPSPLWYDVGFKVDRTTKKLTLPSDTDLGLSAFNVRVVALDSGDKTDFKLPFFIVYNTDITRPQPIVIVGKNLGTASVPEIQLENSFAAGEELWVQVFNLDDLPPQVPETKKARVYVVSAKGSAYEDGDDIANVIFYKDCTVDELTKGVLLDTSQPELNGKDLTPDGNSWTSIPTKAQGKAFSVIVDVDNNSKYNLKKEGTDDYYLDGIDGNMVPGFVVRYPPPPPITTVEYAPANIASGGVYKYNYTTWDYDYDYRDEFKIDGNDTQYAWDWEFGGYGVKATWNPYIQWDSWGSNPNPGLNEASVYYGSYVDVYIIDTEVAKTNPYPEGEPIAASPNWGFNKITLPVQYSCYNGCGQQTIWRSDGDADETNGGLKLGDFDVVVDVDRNGKFSDGDIIDNQPRNAVSPWTPRTKGGFSVVASYSP